MLRWIIVTRPRLAPQIRLAQDYFPSPKFSRFISSAYLSIYHKQLRIERAGMPPAIVAIEDIGIVVLEHPQITLTHCLLSALPANQVVIVTCNDKYIPCGLLLPLEGNTLQQERFEARIEASKPLKKQLCQHTIQAKIRNQANLLTKRSTDAKPLYRWAEMVKSGDSTNLEARAAATYWHNVMRDRTRDINARFLRGQHGEPPNNLLNYGYAILRATTARALVATGLPPTLGIHHANRYNAYCLADDIMEPYRPFVDELVLIMLDSDMDTPEILTPDHKKMLLRVPTLDVRMDDNKSPLMVAMQRTAASLVKCFSGESRKLLYPEMPWFHSTTDSAPTDPCG